MENVVPFALMALSLVAAFAAQAMLLAAREHVRQVWPDWFARLAQGGGGVRIGGPDDRVRRRLARPLLFGLPEGPREDPALAKLAERFRLALLAVGLCAGGLILIISLRMEAAPA